MNAQTASTTQSQHVAPRVAEPDSKSSRNYPGLLASLGFAAFLLVSAPALAATAPPLLTAQSFAVLAGSAVTNTGSSTINGDLGLHPGTSIVGLASLTLTGTVHQTDAVAQQAQIDATAAYTNLFNQGCDAIIPADLGGMTLLPGVYCSTTSMGLTGTVTLDAQGNPNAVFIFKMGSTLTTASGSRVVIINGGSPCNVYWQVGSSATLGTTSQVLGTIIADQSITLTTGASVSGRALARNGAVTLDDNNVVSACNLTVPTVPTVTTQASPGVTLGAAISDSATLSGGANPTGPITFNLYGPNNANCTGAAIFTSTVVVSGNGNYGSGSFTPTAAGTYRWIANYSGNANNAGTANACNAANESVTISAATVLSSAIPTLSETALMILTLLLVGLGAVRIGRR